MASRPDIPALELLVEVADSGSLSAAASALGIAQPNASRQLSRLERRLGARLLDRGARGSEPTAAGRVAIDHARRVLDASDALVEQVRAAAGAGPLRIIASQTIAEHLMPVFLAALAGQGTGETVSFEVGNSSAGLTALRRGRADIGFVEGTDDLSTVASRVVGRDQLVAVVDPRHPWAGSDGIDADELARTPLIVREEGSGTRAVLARALAPRPIAAPALVLHSNAAVRTAVAGGAGPAVLSDLVVQDDLREGRLVRVSVTGVDLRRSLRAVWLGPRPSRLDAPLDQLIERFCDGGRSH